ncbi:MAG TPA: pyruvate, water dikinase regulatory protein [Gallionellaceae bacterium]|nr:pyruvate, water dikinase regulatory protein [Gallionellaceae bacterium]
MSKTRTAFFISDRTGITAENLGHSLLSQFEGAQIKRVRLPFLDSVEKARDALAQINETSLSDGQRPLIFSTLILPAVRNIIEQSDALFLDLFEMFIVPLEAELGISSSHAVGRSHAADTNYNSRMDAVNYALNHDDGGITRDLHLADIILIGVSRCGKTPTSLYLAMQYGISAANYPLVPEDFASEALPQVLKPLRSKLHGLTIRPERLHQIRTERSPNSNYAALENCQLEVKQAENLMRFANIPYLDVTTMSVEEIATTILHQTGLKR